MSVACHPPQWTVRIRLKGPQSFDDQFRNDAAEPIHVGAEAYANLAPSISDIHLVPDFPVEPIIRHGWFVLAAGFEARISVVE